MSAEPTELLHVWSHCHGCGAAPIRGYRFECQTCPDGPDNALCERCHSEYTDGRVQHPKPGSFAEVAVSNRQQRHTFIRFKGIPRSQCSHWAEARCALEPAPRIPDRFVLRPEFCTGRQSFIGSYCFVVAGSPALILTCLHVLGGLIQQKGIDASSRNDAYSGHELPAVVTGVNLYDVYAANWMLAPLGRAASMLSLPNARIKEEEPLSDRDIAAFVIDGEPRLSPVRLAERVPGVGEPIWLAVKPDGAGTKRTFAAVVAEHSERTFIYRYLDDTTAMPRFTSGAPLVNRAGEVVGINVGYGRLDDVHLGHAHHVASIRRHLGRA